MISTFSPQPPWQPRPLRAAETEVLRRLLQFPIDGAADLAALHAGVDQLIVREGCDCGCDALFFDNPRAKGRPVAHGIGVTADNRYVELVLWARDATLTFLELEPLTVRWPRGLARLPRPETLAPIPDDFDDLAYELDPTSALAQRAAQRSSPESRSWLDASLRPGLICNPVSVNRC